MFKGNPYFIRVCNLKPPAVCELGKLVRIGKVLEDNGDIESVNIQDLKTENSVICLCSVFVDSCDYVTNIHLPERPTFNILFERNKKV